MITISVKNLLSAIDKADVFSLPDMNQGTQYVYANLYQKLMRGEELKLSEINFGSFELDDIDSIRELHSKVLDVNENKADSITRTLWNIKPVATASAFV